VRAAVTASTAAAVTAAAGARVGDGGNDAGGIRRGVVRRKGTGRFRARSGVLPRRRPGCGDHRGLCRWRGGESSTATFGGKWRIASTIRRRRSRHGSRERGTDGVLGCLRDERDERDDVGRKFVSLGIAGSYIDFVECARNRGSSAVAAVAAAVAAAAAATAVAAVAATAAAIVRKRRFR
jgi:hypothetical protein